MTSATITSREGERPWETGHIGRYDVRGVLGTGGMGLVVAAHDPQLDREVAIKIVAADHATSTARLIREAKVMARLSHPNVVTIHEVVDVGDRSGIVMELVDGEDLATWRDHGPHSWRDVIAVYVQAGRGLVAAHRAGVVHRDFKPSNALLGKDGVVRVSDFGLARRIERIEPEAEIGGATGSGTDAALTRSGAVVGTPAYMAPEQHTRAAIDARTDQWAFACSIYEALFDQLPFGDARGDLRDRVVCGELVEPRSSNVPRAIRVALRRALAVRPADRFADMDALIAALMAPMLRRSRLVVAAASVTALALVVAIVAMGSSGDEAACEGLDAPVQAAWNPGKSQQLRARMTAAGQPVAITDRVIAILDDHSAAWLARRTQSCTHARQGLESADQLDRQMRCLDQYLVELGSVVDGLLDPAGTNTRSAAGIVDKLRPVADCDHPDEAIPQPAAPSAREAIARAEIDLARAHPLDELDQYERALSLAQAAADVGTQTGWASLEGRALVLVGECQQRLRKFHEAFATFERAASVAAVAQDDTLLTEALVERFLVLAENLGRASDALAGRSYIELSVVRAGQPPRLRAGWLHILAIALDRMGRYDEALAAEREAVSLWRELVPEGNSRLVDALETEANIQIRRKQFTEAEALLREVLMARIAARGPDDTLVAQAENNWGFLEFERGNLEAALEHGERAIQINEAAGTRFFRLYANRGDGHVELGQLHRAFDDYTTARETAEREATPESTYVAECEVALGDLLTTFGAYDRARPYIERSLAAARAAKAPVLTSALFVAARLALSHGDVAQAAADLTELVAFDTDTTDPTRTLLEAMVARAQSGCRGARAAIDRAVAAVANMPYRAERLQAAVVAARCDIERGEPARAAAELDPQLRWFEDRHADAEAIAPARFAMALAIAAQGDLHRALALAEQAQAGLFGVARAEVATWLAHHSVR